LKKKKKKTNHERRPTIKKIKVIEEDKESTLVNLNDNLLVIVPLVVDGLGFSSGLNEFGPFQLLGLLT